MTNYSAKDAPANLPRFFILFKRHWRLGTGLERHSKDAKRNDGCWEYRTFADAMAKHGQRNTDAKTISSWVNGRKRPQDARKVAISKVFFGVPNGTAVDEDTESLRAEFENAWEECQGWAGSNEVSAQSDIGADALKRWLPAGETLSTPGLASARLAEPQPRNELGSGWAIKARIRFDISEQEGDSGSPLYVAVRRALISVTATGCQVETQSVAGQDGQHLHLRPVSDNDSIAIVGPSPEGVLEGDPLGAETLAHVIPVAAVNQEETVEISLYAFRRSFVVSLTPKPTVEAEFTEKQAILNRMIEIGRETDAQGRVLIASDKVCRTTPS